MSADKRDVLYGNLGLRYGATDSRVVVRHTSPTRHPDVTRYGIEWTSLEDPLRRVVFGLVSDARRLSA